MVSLLVDPRKLREAASTPAADSLPAQELERLRAYYGRLTTILAPLAQVTTEAGLQDILSASAAPWVETGAGIAEILLGSPAGRRLLDGTLQFDPEAEGLIAEKADLLGEDNLDRFLGAFESLQGLTEWALPRIDKGGSDAQMVTLLEGLVGPVLLRAQIAITAILMILQDTIPDWKVEAIPLLCSLADESMTEVEDAFFRFRNRAS